MAIPKPGRRARQRRREPSWDESPGALPMVGSYVWAPGTSLQAETSATHTWQSGRVYLHPFVVSRSFRADLITMNVTVTDAGKTAAIGIWSMQPDGTIGDILFQVVQNVAVSGLTSVNADFFFERGPYWVGVASDSTTAAVTALDTLHLRTLGHTSIATNAFVQVKINISWTAGDLLTGYLETIGNEITTKPPRIMFRRAS